SSAAAAAQQYPQYAKQITAAAKASFIDGADWSYAAGLIAILIGATLVYFVFPRARREKELLVEYHETDVAAHQQEPAPT
ncbi:MAG TPA: MFS transporter, partial [Acidimicrobiia bacterium]|nr:MFS transporter [Acidimicrobiia bacterium]